MRGHFHRIAGPQYAAHGGIVRGGVASAGQSSRSEGAADEVGIGSLSRDRFAWIALALYIALGIMLTVHHEAWRDEADTWLMARDAPLSELTMNLGREAHPPLWDLMLLPFARTGFPYETQAVMQLLIASGAAALLFFFAPFPRVWKLLTAFSFYMGYEYLAIARAYSLTVLTLFAMAALYRKRFEHPLAFAAVFALFVNSTVHALIVGVVLGPLFAWQLIRHKTPHLSTAIAIMAIAGAISGLPMYLAGRDAVLPPVHRATEPLLLFSLAGAFAPSFDIITAALAAAIFLIASVAIARDRQALAALWLSWTALMFIFVFVYRATLRQVGLLVMMLMFALWIADCVRPRAADILLKTLLYFSLLLSLQFAFTTWLLEIRYPFSDAKNAAEFLIENHLDQRPIAGHPPGKAEAVLAYLPPRKKMWYPAENRVGSYMDWRPSLWKADEMPPDVAIERALKASNDRNLLILTSRPLTIVEKYKLRLLYTTRGPVFGRPDERYFIYGR